MFLARLVFACVGVGGGVSKMLKFYVKVFYVMGKALSGKLSSPCPIFSEKSGTGYVP